MPLKLGELAAVLKVDKSQFDRGLAEGKAEFKAAGDSMDRDAETSSRSIGAKLASMWRTPQRELASQIDAAKSKLHDLAEQFARTGEKSLLKDMSQGRNELRQLEAAAKDLGQSGFQTLTQGAQSVWSTMGQVGSTVGSAASSLWGLIPIILGVAAAAAFSVPAIGLLGGAIGAIPALSVGAGAGIGVLALGFMGLTDQFKKTSAAGAQTVDTAHQIAIAERNLADAQQNALQAQEALNRAREAAKKNIDDLGRALKDAHLQEEAAVLAVADAEANLEKVRKWGSPDQIARADLAYRQAQQTLEDVRARLKDTEDQQQKAAKAGVEGSDQVKQALQQQHKAVEQVDDAQYALVQAHKAQATAAASAAAETTKLAASAQHLVDVIKSLKGPFDDLRLDVQQRLFAGVGDEVRSLADTWLPVLHSKLGGTADVFNGLFKIFSTSIKKPEFIDGISRGLDSVNHLIGQIGSAAAGPLVDAFGRLAGAAGPFLDAVSSEVAGLVTDFDNWIKKADQSGQLKDFFKKAGDFFHDVVHMGKDVGGIIGDIVKSLFTDPANSKGGSAWESLKKNLDDLKKWFDDPKNEKKVQHWFQMLQTAGEAVLIVAGWIGDLILWLDKAQKKIEGWALASAKTTQNFVDGVGKQWNRLVGWVEGLPGRISRATSGMWNGLAESFRYALNMIIWHWNQVHFDLPTIDWGPIHYSGGTVGVPRIPYLADGGIVRATPGGRLAVVGEGGKDEAVVPLDRLAAMLGGRGGTTRIVAETDDDLLSLLFRAIRWKVNGEYGGSVDAAFAGR